jgi:ATP synthase protein I
MAGGGLEFAVAILLGVFGGQWLDRRWGTSPWLVVVGAMTGAGAGFYKLYRDLTASQRHPDADGAGDDTKR